MANNTLKVRHKQRYDTEANWKSKDPILLAGEMAISSDKNGRFKVGDGKNKWSVLAYSKADLSKSDVTTALGYTPPTTNTTYSTGTASTAGLTKLYTGTGSATDGTMTQSAITSALNGKANSGHSHNYAGSTSAGGAANIAAKLQTYVQNSTTETYGTQYPLYAQWQDNSRLKLKCDNYTVETDRANSVANALSIQLNGGAATTFNGSAAKSVNITPAAIGAAASSHSHNRLEFMGTDSITATSQDTQPNWLKVGNSVHYFSKANELINQPSQYGFVVNTTNGVSDLHQLWMTQPSGSLYHRGANHSGWSGSWRRIIDSTELVGSRSSVGCLNNFNTDWSKIPSLNTLAYWDGAHSTSTDGGTHYSSLAYCVKGPFGNIVTRNVAGVNKYAVSDMYDFGATSTIPTLETLAYWNGAWGMNEAKTWHFSNLTYCNKGAFGTGAVRNISGNITVGTAAPSGTASNGDIYIQIS